MTCCILVFQSRRKPQTWTLTGASHSVLHPPLYTHCHFNYLFSDDWVMSFLSGTLGHFGLEFEEWERGWWIISLQRQLIWLSVCTKKYCSEKDAFPSSLLTPRVSALPGRCSLNSLTACIYYDGHGQNLHLSVSELRSLELFYGAVHR